MSNKRFNLSSFTDEDLQSLLNQLLEERSNLSLPTDKNNSNMRNDAAPCDEGEDFTIDDEFIKPKRKKSTPSNSQVTQENPVTTKNYYETLINDDKMDQDDVEDNENTASSPSPNPYKRKQTKSTPTYYYFPPTYQRQQKQTIHPSHYPPWERKMAAPQQTLIHPQNQLRKSSNN